MAKKMKSPEKNLPSDVNVFDGNEPEVVVTKFTAASSMELEAPTQTPPEAAAGEAFGVAVWNSDKRVNALYNTYHARNSWMSIAGTGWVKLTTASDSACEAMSILAAQAKVKNARIDYATDAGQVTEMYIW
jgi:hypothetical protein